MFLFSKVMPREGKFFDLFDLHAEQMLFCAKELQLLMEDLEKGDSEKVVLRTRNIKGFVSAADRLTQQTMRLLHRIFITPLDREDIHQLINKMDDVLDLIEDASQCISLYDIRKVPAEGRKLAEICVTCVEHLKAAIGMLSDLKHADPILRHCLEIDRLESEADNVMRDIIVKLFRDEPDTRELIKMKAVIELLETVTDRCEDVANIIEGIVIEYS